MTKWNRVWFFGKDKKDTTIDDYVIQYKSEYNEIIEVEYSWSMNDRWYTVKVGQDKVLGQESFYFDTLKEAKLFVEEHRENKSEQSVSEI